MTSAKPRKPGRYLGLSAISVGACFLFEPYIGLLDILPDAVGYLLILVGLYRLSDLDDRLAEASRAAGRLALLGLGRFLAIFLTYGLVSPTEQPVFLLLAAFTLGLLSILLLVPLWHNLGGGLLYLGSRNDATTLFDRRRRGERMHTRSVTERYVSFSLFVFIARELAAVLPELTVLTHTSGGAEWNQHSLYEYVGLFRLVGIAVSFLLGLSWLISTFLYIHRLKSDEPFFGRLRERYEREVLTREDLLAMRAVKAAMAMLGAATVFFLDFYIEGVDVLPDFIGAILLALGLVFLRRYVGKQVPAMLATLGYGTVSLILWIMQFGYFNIDDAAEVLDVRALSDRWSTVSFLQTLAAVLLVLSFVLILRTLFDLVKHHTGVRAFRDGSAYATERTDAIHTHIRKKLIVVGVFAGLTALSTLAHWILIPQLPALDFPGRPETGDVLVNMAYDALRQAYWFVDLLVGGALVATIIHAGSEIAEQMDYSYLMN